MYIGKFKTPFHNIFLINNFNIPIELCNLIKEYAYYDNKCINFLKELTKHKKEISLIKSAWSRNNVPNWLSHPVEVITDDAEHWIFGFCNVLNFADDSLYYYGHDFEKLQLQAENCSKCGEYKILAYSTNINATTNLKICNC
jgi:ribosomal protein S27AE